MPTHVYRFVIANCFILLIVACSHQQAGLNTVEQAAFTAISEYADKTYGTQLSLTPSQIKQLTWVQDNPLSTPEMATQPITPLIHIEVKRALARIYCLQLLKEGSEDSYKRFITAQTTHKNQPVLEKDSFRALSSLIQQLDNTSYEALAAAAIISAVTLSPAATQSAEKVLTQPLPSDSNQFLAETAPYAAEIYPLAQTVVQKHPHAHELFKILFMPDSQLRHMMYNEGSLSMYHHILKGIAAQRINQQSLDLWYAHWVINIAGFRGHVDPNGSLYLNQNTYMAINELKSIFNRLLKGESINPMTTYLNKRAYWLGAPNLTQNLQMQTALGSLGACLRLFTQEQGKALFEGVAALDKTVRNQWLAYTQKQLAEQPYQTETYAPAVFANTREKIGLKESILIVMPLYVSVLTAEKKLRAAQPPQLKNNIPVSFRKLASNNRIEMLIQLRQPFYQVTINPTDGIADIVKK